jgi:16S rRNA (uracil1498-N3)-methyltransferase
MTAPRLFVDVPLSGGATIDLPEGPFRHLVQVLRMQAGEALVLFDGRGGEYEAQLASVAKRSATVSVGAHRAVDRESALDLTLVQGISKGERMDFTIQKAVELGVTRIAPVTTERCNVHLDAERQEKRMEHWRGVIVSACEQSGRTRVPGLDPVRSLAAHLAIESKAVRFVLDPQAGTSLAAAAQAVQEGQAMALIVGPEGGLGESELQLAARSGVSGVNLGPRVLRTETAGMTALAVLQATRGDLRR